MVEEDLLEAFDFLHQKAVLQLAQLLQSQVAVFENEVLFTCKPVALDDISPSVAFDHVKDLVQLPSSKHELKELVTEHYLRVVVSNLQVILLREESSSFLADWELLDIV